MAKDDAYSFDEMLEVRMRAIVAEDTEELRAELDELRRLIGEGGGGEESDAFTREEVEAFSLKELRAFAKEAGCPHTKKDDVYDWLSDNYEYAESPGDTEDEEEEEVEEEGTEEEEEGEAELRAELAELDRTGLKKRLRGLESGAKIFSNETDDDLRDRILGLELATEETELGQDAIREMSTNELIALAGANKVRIPPPYRKPENREKFAEWLIEKLEKEGGE